jgi:hypothetical protein
LNAEIQRILFALAEENGLRSETADDTLLLFSSGQYSEPPVAVIHLDQPQHEVIFAFLHEIGHFAPRIKNPRPLRMPWFINRSYENERLGEAVYKTRRALRQILNKEWQADAWALCVYSQIRCPDDLKAFLKQHPKKRLLFIGTLAAHAITPIRKFIRELFYLFGMLRGTRRQSRGKNDNP